MNDSKNALNNYLKTNGDFLEARAKKLNELKEIENKRPLTEEEEKNKAWILEKANSISERLGKTIESFLN